MNLEIPAHTAAQLNQLAATFGKTPAALVEQAISLYVEDLFDQEAQLNRLKAELALGVADMQAGKTRPLTDEAFIKGAAPKNKRASRANV